MAGSEGQCLAASKWVRWEKRSRAAGRGAGAGPWQPARVWSAPRSSSRQERAGRARPLAHSEAALASHWLPPPWRGGAPLPGKKCNCVKKSSPG